MYCYKCGKEIDNEAVVCIHCGVATKNAEKNKENPIIINNSSSASSSASSCNRPIRRHGFLFDLLMIFLTGGLWIIWMIIRPKYY